MMEQIKESTATIEAPVQKVVDRKMEVFYNPVMKLNRDISVLTLKAYGKNNMKIADPLAGSGIRTIRFIQELNSEIIQKIFVNDKKENYSEYINKMVELNELSNSQKSKIIASQEDANVFLIANKPFDYIDIDPFGTPNPFLDSAVRSTQSEGILAVTATDTSALCGSYPKACMRKYWSLPLRNEIMHEFGLRILIRKVQLIGAHHQRALVPILSYSMDHYMRIFFRFDKGKPNIDKIMEQHNLFLSSGKQYGPIWTGELNDLDFLKKIISIYEHDEELKKNIGKDAIKLVNSLIEETQIGGIGFFDVHEISREFKGKEIPKFELIFDALKKQGFKFSRTHFLGTGIKTNASKEQFIEIYKTLL